MGKVTDTLFSFLSIDNSKKSGHKYCVNYKKKVGETQSHFHKFFINLKFTVAPLTN